MNNLVQSHLSRHPKARPTTISDKIKIQATCEQLRSEIAGLHHANEFRARVNHQPEAGLLARTVNVLGKLFKVLAARLVQ